MSAVTNALSKATDTLIEAGTKELQAQGHALTGQAAASMTGSSTEESDGFRIVIRGLDYLLSLDSGVPFNRIPFSPGTRTGAGQSLYIQGLKEFALRRGMASTDKEALQIAFMIAHRHRQNWSSQGFGMPTQNSYQYSQNGARTGWIKAVLKQTVPAIAQSILQALLQDNFYSILNKKAA